MAANSGPATRRWRMAAGVVLIAAGVAMIASLVYIGNSTSPAAERVLVEIGLAGGALLSAAAQAGILIGAWMIWKMRRRPPRAR